MSTSAQNVVEMEINAILQNYEFDILIPKMVLQNEWESNNTLTYAFYVSKPSPIYNLSALQLMFRDALIRDGIDPTSRIKVGGKAHNCRDPRPVLALNTFYMNPAILKGYTRVKARRLTVRWPDHGFTLMFWNRAARLVVFKGHHLGAGPAEFMHQLLLKLNYRKYLAVYVLSGNREYRLRRLNEAIQMIKVNKARGWPMVL